ncbi:prenylcysteine oxidase / farnesylcysteine lyase, partial [Phenoliferia sp. Uapishka_3]
MLTSLSSEGKMVVCFIAVTLALGSIARAQLLFPANTQLPFDFNDQAHHNEPATHPAGPGHLWATAKVPKIAIIGAGAAGSSASYYLRHFSDLKDEGLDSDVTIFESSNYVGGRSTVIWPWNDDPYETPTAEDDNGEEPVELGASIFVEANKNLRKAATIFNLTLVDHDGGESGGMSIWDGAKFAYTESKGWGWGYWDLAKMFWRYGRSPLHVRDLIKTTVDDFTSLYSSDFVSSGAFDSLHSFSASTNLTHPSSLTALEFFNSNKISTLFTTELIAAATTVNYGTPVSKIHGVGALVSLAATGATAIKGGNRKIFENFVGASGARLRLGKGGTVTEIVKLDAVEGQRAQWMIKTASGNGGGTFDAVIIATPFHLSSLKVLNSPTPALIPTQPYVSLHVTFIITNASTPLPSYFSLPPRTSISKAIFATFDTPSIDKPKWNSLNYQRTLKKSTGEKFGEGEWHVIKMFSEKTLERAELDKVFGEGNVGKVWEKVHRACPSAAVHPEHSSLLQQHAKLGIAYEQLLREHEELTEDHEAALEELTELKDRVGPWTWEITNTSLSPIASLSAELLLRTLDLARPTTKELLGLALVSRKFARPAQTLLFRDIRFGRPSVDGMGGEMTLVTEANSFDAWLASPARHRFVARSLDFCALTEEVSMRECLDVCQGLKEIRNLSIMKDMVSVLHHPTFRDVTSLGLKVDHTTSLTRHRLPPYPKSNLPGRLTHLSFCGNLAQVDTSILFNSLVRASNSTLRHLDLMFCEWDDLSRESTFDALREEGLPSRLVSLGLPFDRIEYNGFDSSDGELFERWGDEDYNPRSPPGPEEAHTLSPHELTFISLCTSLRTFGGFRLPTHRYCPQTVDTCITPFRHIYEDTAIICMLQELRPQVQRWRLMGTATEDDISHDMFESLLDLDDLDLICDDRAHEFRFFCD